ncbi:thiamine pyrophosphate-dependent dehydrogenase E1 component subunit alpha [Conexibacter sp. CPCC 206217]|uniref:thiamine pyrophosphate-dependent dehydrogenase E1 component subunit alpha n=1 Tax=Conexibacter sp. CPCC 206217 TaxID=3064574 RepID=UPI00271CC5D7|nr:thiamine pyrophosphate-dependent dehydrogenase E1 component subunit alpha [Conexibacter sp. CPCC 206217]MDO8212675.1 thiamine pyrophosphate-dependent dehydrogenase E1 component subunit alpha [Conexibacter sp. CPCC 206217]
MSTTSTTAEREAVVLGLYRQMARIRRFEEVAYRAYETGEVTGTIHASIGQEAVAAGAIAALRPDDLVFTHHRGHGHALAKGVDPARLFGELMGRSNGVSGGKGGSMHATDVAVGFLGSYAVVGGSIPLAVGVALAARRRGQDVVTVAFFGDGAVNQGILYESFNLAQIWSLPVLFVCENNGYAISVPSGYSTAGSGVTERARAFGLQARTVDGQSAVEMHAATSELAQLARDGQPGLLEAITYRLVGHSRGDPAHGLYRTQEEWDSWSERDPLSVHARAHALDDAVREQIHQEAREQMDAALQTARDAPPPAPEEATSEVWGP